MGAKRDLGLIADTTLTSTQLFSETQGRFLLTVRPEDQAAFEAIAQDQAVQLGVVSTGDFDLKLADGEFHTQMSQLTTIYSEALACALK